MRGPIGTLLLGALLLNGCGGGDARAQLRDACDSLIEAARNDPSAAAETALHDLRIKVNEIAKESQDSGTDTHELAAQLWLAIDQGGSVSQAMLRGSGACSQAYDNVKER